MATDECWYRYTTIIDVDLSDLDREIRSNLLYYIIKSNYFYTLTTRTLSIYLPNTESTHLKTILMGADPNMVFNDLNGTKYKN